MYPPIKDHAIRPCGGVLQSFGHGGGFIGDPTDDFDGRPVGGAHLLCPVERALIEAPVVEYPDENDRDIQARPAVTAAADLRPPQLTCLTVDLGGLDQRFPCCDGLLNEGVELFSAYLGVRDTELRQLCDHLLHFHYRLDRIVSRLDHCRVHAGRAGKPGPVFDNDVVTQFTEVGDFGEQQRPRRRGNRNRLRLTFGDLTAVALRRETSACGAEPGATGARISVQAVCLAF